MKKLQKLKFVAFNINGSNYLSWVLDVETHLNAMNLGETIKEEKTTTSKKKPENHDFLHHHIDE